MTTAVAPPAAISAGVSVWPDDLSRPRPATGNPAGLILDHGVTGVTADHQP